MALIEYKINRDESGNVTVVATVFRMDPGDEVRLTSDVPNASVQWPGASPFGAPADGAVYAVPHTTAAPEGLPVIRTIDMSQSLASCGELDAQGHFVQWGGAGFSPVGTTNRA